MKLAISNIAWDPSEDDAVAAVLQREGVDGIEIAPTKWRAEPLSAGARDIAAFRAAWESRGLPIVAMQSLLFGRADLQLLGSRASRDELAGYLRGMLDFAAAVGAGAVVFGSPKNRVRGEMDLASANQITVDFLSELAPYAADRGVAFCLEPVPARYGCDYIHTPAEALAIVRRVNSRGVFVNADLGAITAAGEEPRAALESARDWIGHFHASETDFVPLELRDLHESAAEALKAIGYERWVSIEMKAVGEGRNVEAVERAVKLARACYPRARDSS